MTGIWRVFLILAMLTWWSLLPAAAAKVEKFKDDQGKLHITNVGPEEPGKPEAPSPATPLRPKMLQPRPPEVTEPPVHMPETPVEPGQGQPAAPPQAEVPPEVEVQPNSG